MNKSHLLLINKKSSPHGRTFAVRPSISITNAKKMAKSLRVRRSEFCTLIVRGEMRLGVGMYCLGIQAPIGSHLVYLIEKVAGVRP